jgi:hypothetical protein
MNTLQASLKGRASSSKAFPSQITELFKVSNDKEGNGIHATGRGGPQSCETSKLPHFRDDRQTDGGEISLMFFYCQEDSWYSFLLEDKSTPEA